MSRADAGKPKRIFVHAGLGTDQSYRVEALAVRDPEGMLRTLLEAASAWASDARLDLRRRAFAPMQAVSATPLLPLPSFSPTLPPTSVSSNSHTAEEVRLFSKEERDYLSHQTQEEREHLASSLKLLKATEGASVPMRIRVLMSSLPEDLKRRVLQKLEKHQESLASGDSVKYYTWVEALLALPLNRVVVPLVPPKGPDLGEMLRKAAGFLDAKVFGHASAKQALLERLYAWLRHPQAPQRALALQGPPGNGKTTLVREGFSFVSGRPFCFVALGGSFDSSSLLGHSFTYEGSTQGRIAEGLASCKCMNPVFYFDELDKCSATPKGEEIVNALLHLTDASQNSHFRDRYFAGLDLDVSKALFVFSFNDQSKISPVLLDRLQVVPTDSFTPREQVHIVRDYLLPRILQEHQLASDFLDLSQDVLVEATSLLRKGGVRAIRSALEQVVCKVSIYAETAEVTLMYPLTPSDVTRLPSGRYLLKGGIHRILADAAGHNSAPPSSMYS